MGRKKLPNILDEKEVQKLLEIPSKKSITGIRNKAILRLMLTTGLRVSEVSNLKHWEIDTNAGELKVTQGKGSKDRLLFIPEFAKEDLERWEKRRSKNAYYFHTHYETKVSIRYIEAMVERYANKAKLTKKITPHSLRHFYATQNYKQFKDIERLRITLGHEDIATTQIYVTLAGTEIEENMRSFKPF